METTETLCFETHSKLGEFFHVRSGLSCSFSHSCSSLGRGADFQVDMWAVCGGRAEPPVPESQTRTRAGSRAVGQLWRHREPGRPTCSGPVSPPVSSPVPDWWAPDVDGYGLFLTPVAPAPGHALRVSGGGFVAASPRNCSARREGIKRPAARRGGGTKRRPS